MTRNVKLNTRVWLLGSMILLVSAGKAQAGNVFSALPSKSNPHYKVSDSNAALAGKNYTGVNTKTNLNRPGQTFVGYRGTTTRLHFLYGVKSSTSRANQLGDGYYVTPDYQTAKLYAKMAAADGGEPLVVEVYADEFSSMTKKTITKDIKTEGFPQFDYVEAPLSTLPKIDMKSVIVAPQIKFNQQAFSKLHVQPFFDPNDPP